MITRMGGREGGSSECIKIVAMDIKTCSHVVMLLHGATLQSTPSIHPTSVKLTHSYGNLAIFRELLAMI